MAMATNARVFFLALLLLLAPPLLFQVVRCELSLEPEERETSEGGAELGIVGEDAQAFGDGIFSPAPGVETICVSPKNGARLVPAGEKTELLVGMKNDGNCLHSVSFQQVEEEEIDREIAIPLILPELIVEQQFTLL